MNRDAVTFSRRVFRFAGIYGLIVLLPQYFLEGRIGQDTPPPITHPEFFYGFLGVAIAWQVVFLIIAHNPPRFRPLMLAGVVEKFSFGIATVTLYIQKRVSGAVVAFGVLDMALGAAFLAVWMGVGRQPESGNAPGE